MYKESPLDDSVEGIKVVYEDGSVHRIPLTEIETGWNAAPEFGVQVVSIFPKEKINGRQYPQWFASRDFYAWSKSRGIIETNDVSGLPSDCIVKVGSEMDKEAFRALYNKVMQDHEF